MSDTDTTYVVSGQAAYLTQLNPLDGKPYRTLLYQGTLVPGSATPEEIEHNLSVGLIAPLEVVPEGPGAPPDPDDPSNGPAGQVEEPARNASTDEWRAYALAAGASEADIDGLKRDELVDKYGTPAP